jgi:hypothetical protein
MTTVCRSAAAFAASAVLCMALAPAAFAGGDMTTQGPDAAVSPSPAAPAMPPVPAAAPPSPPLTIPAGLYGSKDPTDDGVWRQSLTLLGQYAAGLRPANEAVAWLEGQQCANGAFPVYRAAPEVPCDATTKLDSHATAAAVQALSTIVGQRPVMQRAMDWLWTVQNEDGGWSRRPHDPSDSHSTSLVIGALASAGVRPSMIRTLEGKSPYDALVGLSVPCGTEPGEGAFSYRKHPAGELFANANATTAGLLGGTGKRMVVSSVKPGPAPSCKKTAAVRTPERAARNGAAYLASLFAESDHLDLPRQRGAEDSAPRRPDPGGTADAVAAMWASGYGNQAAGALKWLKKNAVAWAEQEGPAAYARLIFAAHTTNTDPHHFGGVDLVERLNAGGPAPLPGVSVTPLAAEVGHGSDGGGFGVMWVAAIGLLGCACVGMLVNNRRKAAASDEHTP